MPLPNIEDIKQRYVYDREEMNTSVRFFPERSIATISQVTEQDDIDGLTTEIVEMGMERSEIEEFFPPAQGQKGDFNLSLLIRSIIYEAFQKEGIELEEGNVRNFWYTHLKGTITTILGLRESPTVASTINKSWGELINSGLVTYEGMNIVGGKEASRLSIVKDSPFNNLIIAVEKMDFFESFKWIPKLFNCTLITAGGQPRRTVARAFIRQLKHLGVNLSQRFYMCVASDLDPAGFYIQEAFRKQLEAAIEFYGGEGDVKIRRLFVRKDQVTEELLLSEAMPCKDQARTTAAKKAEATKWKFFCKHTDGGLYIPKPPEWDGPVYDIDEKEMVRALLEMNAFPKRIIERAILKELLRIIEATNDETKIMIPEIMRIFELMREEAIEDLYNNRRNDMIKPLIDAFLEETEQWKRDIRRREREETRVAKEDRDSETEPIEERYDALVEEKEQETRDQEPELYLEKERLENEIERLQEELSDTDAEIGERCADIFSEIEDLRNQETNELQPFLDAFDKEEQDIEARKEYRTDKMEEFKEEHATVFNPVEMALKEDIATALSQENVVYYFTDIEEMDRFQPHIGRLLTEPTLLLEEGLSCFKHAVPAFIEEDLLTRASERHDENIEGVRNAFAPRFMQEMKGLIREHGEAMEFELREEVEVADLSLDIEEAMERVEREIDEGAWDHEE